MKETLKQAGRLFPADAQTAEVLQPADRAFHGPASLVAAQDSAILRGLESVGAMRGDHRDASRRKCGVERVAVVGFVADDALGVVVADHAVEQALDQMAFVRPSRGGVGGDRQALASTRSMIFTPLPMRVTPIPSPPWRALLKVASTKHS